MGAKGSPFPLTTCNGHAKTPQIRTVSVVEVALYPSIQHSEIARSAP